MLGGTSKADSSACEAPITSDWSGQNRSDSVETHRVGRGIRPGVMFHILVVDGVSTGCYISTRRKTKASARSCQRQLATATKGGIHTAFEAR